jgi:hypothetical protein
LLARRCYFKKADCSYILNLFSPLPIPYKKLNEKGEISDHKLKEVLSLLDKYKNYSHQEFKEKLEGIFL